MRIQDFLSRLEGVKPAGQDKWMAQCPAHQDSSPSLSVQIGNKGILCKCFAGCSIDEITAAVGIATKDLFDDAQNGKASDGPQEVSLQALAAYVGLPAEVLAGFGLSDARSNGRQVVEVPYFDEDGSVLRVKMRTALNGKPKYLWRPGEGNYLYGEWRIAEAREKKSLIFTEGESDCWSLWAIGATTAVGVPGSEADKVLHKEHLAGIEKVWICQDNDKPGEDLTEKLVKLVDGFAPTATIRVVKPPKPYKDISEWRRSMGSLAEFEQTMRAAFKGAPTAKQLKSPLVRMSDVQRKPLSYCWKPYIPEGYGTIMAGKPGHGKSFVCAALCAAVSRGVGIEGTEVSGPGNVILMSSEDDIAAVIQPRLQRCGADLSRVFAFDFMVDDFMIGAAGALRLAALCEEYQPKLIILDPLVSFLSSEINMNQAHEVRAAMRPMIAVAARYKTALMITAHVHKGNVAEAMDAVMGSTDFGAVVRSGMLIYRDPEIKPDPLSSDHGYVISHAKHNLTTTGRGIRYVIRPAADAPDDGELLWNGESKYSAEQLKGIRTEDLWAHHEAKEFLIGELGAGTKMVKDVRNKARTVGIKPELLDSARRELGVEQYRDFNGDIKWRLGEGP